MTRRSRVVSVGLWCLVLGLLCWAPTGAAPVVDRLNRTSGQVGHTVLLQGADLAGTVVEVRFGRAPALDVQNPGGSDTAIQLRVPNKVDPRDPDTVTVTVTVDGVEASASEPPLQFTYTVPQPLPGITDLATGDPVRPKTVLPNEPFVLTLTGSNFLTGLRVPERCIALGPDEQESEVLVGPPGDTSVSFSFSGLRVAGDYEFLIGFSDGARASIAAPGFVEKGPIFGFPPVIQSASVLWNPQQLVECDFTTIVETYLCTQGFAGAHAESPILVGGSFTHVSLQARVTDPDSTPGQTDVLLVSASFVNPNSQIESTLVLFDDGSVSSFPFQQRSSFPEDCTGDEFGSCVCGPKRWSLVSKDAVPLDELYTREVALVDRNTPSAGLLQDCIMAQFREPPIVLDAGATLDFRIEAVDRQGNLATWPSRPAVTVGGGAFSCSGDECGCCLLTSSTPALDCQGKPGMPTAELPEGVCLSVF
jgi:hypothetical protein